MATAQNASGNSAPAKRSSTRGRDSTVANLELLVPGKYVVVLYNQLEQKGTVRYVGTTSFSDGQWVGIELEDANGKNNGTVLGTVYFECPENFGIFVRPKNIIREVGGQASGKLADWRQSDQPVIARAQSDPLQLQSPSGVEVGRKITRRSKTDSRDTEEGFPPLPEEVVQAAPARTRKLRLKTRSAASSSNTPRGGNSDAASEEEGMSRRSLMQSDARDARDTLSIPPDLSNLQKEQMVSLVKDIPKEKKGRLASAKQDRRTFEDFFHRFDERMDRVDQRLDDIWDRVDLVRARVSNIEHSILSQIRSVIHGCEPETPQSMSMGESYPNAELMEAMASRVADRVRGRDEEFHRLTLELEGARREMGRVATAELQRVAMDGTEEDFLHFHRKRPSETDGQGRGAVHYASMAGNLAVLKCAASPANVNASDNDGLTPLHYSAAGNHLEVLRYLVDNAADLHAEDHEERNAADWAAWCGHSGIVSFLEALGKEAKNSNADGPSAPHWAASCGHAPLLRSFVRANVDVNGVDDFAMTPLHYAAACGHAEALDFLVANGGNLKALDRERRDAIYWASWCKRYDLLRTFAAEGFSLRPPVLVVNLEAGSHQCAGEYVLEPDCASDGQPTWRKGDGAATLRIYSNREGCWCIGDSLITHMIPHMDTMPHCMQGPWYLFDDETQIWKENTKIRITEKPNRSTAAEWAAARGHVNLLKCMASAGLDLDAVVQMLVKCSGVEDVADSETNASEKSRPPSPERKDTLGMLAVLTEAGADVNAQDEEGRTLLMDAASDDKLPVMKRLQQSGARLSLVDVAGSTAVHHAAKDGQMETLHYLAEARADVCTRDLSGNTPLHFAAAGGHLEAVKWLILVRADPTAQNNDGLSAASVASEMGEPKIAQYMQSTFPGQATL